MIGNAHMMNALTPAAGMSLYESEESRGLMGRLVHATYRLVVVGLSLLELFGAQVKVCNHLLLPFAICG